MTDFLAVPLDYGKFNKDLRDEGYSLAWVKGDECYFLPSDEGVFIKPRGKIDKFENEVTVI